MQYESTVKIGIEDSIVDKNGAVSKGNVETKSERSPILKPLSFTIGRTSYKFNYGGRVQPRFDYYPEVLNNSGENKLYFRRIRFKSNGHLATPELKYKFEIDFVNFQILDLILQWHFNDHLSVWAGQTKLRGNRERVISSQDLQLVDRSLLNSKFTLDRDIGVWIMHDKMYGKFVIREILSVSKGEGITYIFNDPEPVNTGLDYTARIEILPFGYFSNKGDYSGSDLAREKSPRLALGFTYDINVNAIRSRGQKGDILDRHGDLSSFFADAMFKYNGISWMSEYVYRKLLRDYAVSMAVNDPYINDFYTGIGFNTQIAYLFLSNVEIASRFTKVMPEENTGENNLTEYTIGLSKFLNGHKLKVQSDISLLREESKDDMYRFRIQLELSL